MSYGNGGRREAASKMLQSAGYPSKVPQSGGKDVHFGPNAENAATAPDSMGMFADGGRIQGRFADGGRARTSGATPSSPMTPTSSDNDGGGMKRGGRAKGRRHHAPRIVPPPPPDDAAAMADAGAGGGPPPMDPGAMAAAGPPAGAPPPDMTGAPAPGQQPFKRGGKAQPGIGQTNRNNPGMGAGGGMGRLRKAGLA